MLVVREWLIVVNVCFVVGWRWLGERGGSVCVCMYERENVLSHARAYPGVDGKLKTNNEVSNQSAYSSSNSFFFHSSFILLAFFFFPRNHEPFNCFLDIR